MGTSPKASGAYRVWLTPLCVLTGLWIFYLMMFLNYRAYDIDNPWFLSFSRNFCLGGVQTDQFLDVKFPYGMDGTQIFGKIAAGVQCAVLQPAGWQQWPAAMLAVSLVGVGLGLWWLLLRKLGYSIAHSLFVLIALGLSEPVVAAANRFRYEQISFPLVAAGLLLAAFHKPFWAIFVASLALEVEPAALAGVLPVMLLCALLNKKPWLSLLLQIMAGLGAAACIYIILHRDLLQSSQILGHVGNEAAGERGGFFASYFLDRHRHLPELVIFSLSAIIYWTQRRLVAQHALVLCAGLVTTVALMLPHGNTAYMIFLYPFLVTLAAQAFHVERHLRVSLFLVASFFLAQYGFLAFLNHGHGYRSRDIALVSSAIADAAGMIGMSDDTVRIYGDYSLWFAHPSNYRAAALNTVPEIRNADLYLCYDRSIESQSLSPVGMLHCPEMQRLLSLQLIESVLVRNNVLRIYKRY